MLSLARSKEIFNIAISLQVEMAAGQAEEEARKLQLATEGRKRRQGASKAELALVQSAASLILGSDQPAAAIVATLEEQSEALEEGLADLRAQWSFLCPSPFGLLARRAAAASQSFTLWR